MDHDSHSAWINRRVACNLDATFERLAEIVRENVEVANNLEEKDRDKATFTFQKHYDRKHPTFAVQRRRGGANGRTVAFAKTPEGIRVGCLDHPEFPNGEFVAVPVWDMKEQICFLHINGKQEDKYQLPEISELALWYLFFNSSRPVQ